MRSEWPSRGGFGESRRPWWRIPLYPIVFPCVIVLLVWATVGVSPVFAIRPLVVVFAVGALVTLICCALVRDRDRGGVLATVVLIALFVTGAEALTVVVISAITLVVESVVRRGIPWRFGPLITRLLTMASVIVLIATGIRVVQDGVISAAMTDLADEFVVRPGPPTAVAGRPDIIVILLDAYPGPRGAAHVPDFDARAFPSALEERGFAVQADSHSNYMFTPLTMASMLWMQHIDDIPTLEPPWDAGNADDRRLRRAVNEAPVWDLLASKGYELVSVASGYDHVDIRRVDRVVSRPEPSDFELALAARFPVGTLLDSVFPDLVSGLVRSRMVGSLDAVRQVAAEAHDRPRLVLGHIPAPHFPFVFGAHGEPRTVRLADLSTQLPRDLGISEAEAFRLVMDQATYIASLTIDVVDDVVSANPEAVVVVMSDHGSGVGFDTTDIWSIDLVERFSNIMAIRAPGHPDILARTLTPVNLMPRILGATLAVPLPEATDATYAWTTSILDTRLVTPVPEWAP